MAEFRLRVDIYLEADDIEQACHTVMDALSRHTTDAYILDGATAEKEVTA